MAELLAIVLLAEHDLLRLQVHTSVPDDSLLLERERLVHLTLAVGEVVLIAIVAAVGTFICPLGLGRLLFLLLLHHDELSKVHLLVLRRVRTVITLLRVVARVHQFNLAGLVIGRHLDLDAAALGVILICLLASAGRAHGAMIRIELRIVLFVDNLIFLVFFLNLVMISVDRSVTVQILQVTLGQVVRELLLLDVGDRVNVLELSLTVPILVEQVVVAA